MVILFVFAADILDPPCDSPWQLSYYILIPKTPSPSTIILMEDIEYRCAVI